MDQGRAVLKARGCDDCDNQKTPGKDPGKRPCGRVRYYVSRCFRVGLNRSNVSSREERSESMDHWSGLWQRAVLKARGCKTICDNEKTCAGMTERKRPCGRVRAFSFSGLG